MLLDAYKSADSESQKVIISSATDHKTYTKEQVMSIFDCPKYKIDAAQKWHKAVGPLHEQKKLIFTRRKLNIDNVKHFLEFLVSSGLMQDITYMGVLLYFTNTKINPKNDKEPRYWSI